MNTRLSSLLSLTIMMLSFHVDAKTPMEECLLQKFHSSDENLTLKEIKELCKSEIDPVRLSQQMSDSPTSDFTTNKDSEVEAFVIRPFRQNYILPFYASDKLNNEAYRQIDGFFENFSDLETHFQISLKVPINESDFFFDDDKLYLGFTLEAWWQTFSENISKPFRETNYRPELFYVVPTEFDVLGGNTSFFLGIEHQSNGRSQLLSRSWNRAYAGFIWEKDDLIVSFKPWYRLSEDEKMFEFDPDGDDNPDIKDFYGNFELDAVYRWNSIEFTAMGRRNFSTNNGALELGLTFPLVGNLRGYFMVFDGYGDSLIDYNYKQSRIGLGVAFDSFLD